MVLFSSMVVGAVFQWIGHLQVLGCRGIGAFADRLRKQSLCKKEKQGRRKGDATMFEWGKSYTWGYGCVAGFGFSQVVMEREDVVKHSWMKKEWVGARWRGTRSVLVVVATLLFVGMAAGQSPESVGPPTITPHKTSKPRATGTSNGTSRGTEDVPAPTAKSPPHLRSKGDNAVTDEPPSMPVDEIIKRFSEKESEFKRERGNYTYTQMFTIQTLDEDNRPDGDYRMTSDIVFTPDGNRFEKVTFAPAPTLQRISLSQQA